jgi:hypothetical protein
MPTRNLATLLLALVPIGAGAYETGQLSCDNVGQLAGHALSAKQSGVPHEVYLKVLNERLPAEAQIERKLLTAVATIVYEEELWTAMQPSDAYAVFREDCLRSSAADERQQQEPDDSMGKHDRDGQGQDDRTQELQSWHQVARGWR